MILRCLTCCVAAVIFSSCAANLKEHDHNVDKASPAEWSVAQVGNEFTHLSIGELEQRTAAGDTKAQAELGARYGKGEGVEKNLEKAIDLLKDAAKKGEPSAEFFLGTAYYSGLGVPHSLVEAIMWFEKAAGKGHAAAQYWLAVQIKEGRGGISPNWEAAIPLLWKSAMQGYGDAEFLLGSAYQMGTGVERNVSAAAYWYRRNLSKERNLRSYYNLSLLITRGEVEWQPGDHEDLKTLSTQEH